MFMAEAAGIGAGVGVEGLAAKRWEEDKSQIPAPRLAADRAIDRVSRGLGSHVEFSALGIEQFTACFGNNPFPALVRTGNGH
jgi:hypothetical protein